MTKVMVDIRSEAVGGLRKIRRTLSSQFYYQHWERKDVTCAHELELDLVLG